MYIQPVTLTPEIHEAKYQFMYRYDPQVPMNTLSYEEKISVGHSFIIQIYLKEVYNINTPESFRKALLKEHFRNYPQQNFHMPFKIVDAIIFACEMWREYLASENDFIQLVKEELLKFASINCSVINVKDFEKRARVHLHVQPPSNFQTIVTQRGAIKVYS